MIHSSKLDNYLNAFSSNQSGLLDDLERETHLKTLSPNMISGKVQGRFLSMISNLMRPQTILEIGTFTGFATLCLAEGLRKGGKIHTIESNPEILYLAKKYFDKSSFKENIILHEGEALSVIPKLKTTFDLVFIDADKENYLPYYKMVVEMLSPSGVILADNVMWYGKVLDDPKDKKTKALHEFNSFVSHDERVSNVIIPLRDGIHFIQLK